MSKRNGPRPPKPEGAKERPKRPKAQSLQALSRAVPTDAEFASYFTRIDAMSDREAVIALCAMFDGLLERALSWKFQPFDDDAYAEMFIDKGAPLGTLSSRIIAAKALGLLTPEMRKQADEIRRVRNVFAHAIRQLDFSDPGIAAACQKLDVRKMVRPNIDFQAEGDTARARFNDALTFICHHLLYFVQEAGDAASKGTWRMPRTFHGKYS